MKNWRDLFYFSASERRALTFLSLLIIGIGIALWCTSPVEKEEPNSVSLVSAGDSTLLHNFSTKSDSTLLAKPTTAKVKPNKSAKQERRRFQTPYTSNRTPYVSNKYPQGTIIELNSADTLELQKIPGIGSSFSRRIVKYRSLLGGFFSVTQLAEVYGIDEDRYNQLHSWFRIDTALITPLYVNQADFRTMLRHPYLNKQQTIALQNHIKRNGRLNGWMDIRLLEEFSVTDFERLRHYFSFE